MTDRHINPAATPLPTPPEEGEDATGNEDTGTALPRRPVWPINPSRPDDRHRARDIK